MTAPNSVMELVAVIRCAAQHLLAVAATGISDPLARQHRFHADKLGDVADELSAAIGDGKAMAWMGEPYGFPGTVRTTPIRATAEAWERDGGWKVTPLFTRPQGQGVDAVFANCRVVFYPKDGSYPLEHSPHANKDMKDAILSAIAANGGVE